MSRWEDIWVVEEPLQGGGHHFGDHLTPAVLLSMNTGLRRGELLKLRWLSIDFGRRLLTVDDAACAGDPRLWR
jgi:integrase